MSSTTRSDPLDDSLLIDARAPRFNQAVVAFGAFLGAATGWWPLFGVLALQLGLSLRFGRRFCLPCVFYFRVVQPRWGAGPLEDARAPRFANILGALFLTSATVASALGFVGVGRVLGGLVGGLAALAVVTGVCVGCEVYRLVARLRGVRGGVLERIDLEGLGVLPAEELVVLFTHPLCSECQTLEPQLTSEGRRVVTVDVSQRRDLASRYGVTLVPLAVSVRGDGRVLGVLRSRPSH